MHPATFFVPLPPEPTVAQYPQLRAFVHDLAHIRNLNGFDYRNPVS